MATTKRTRILLCRHGTTDANTAGCFLGQTDSPLNEEGRAEADALAARLAREGIDSVASSDLGRARETAERIALVCGPSFRVDVDPRLRELHMGDLEMQPVASGWAAYPELQARWLADPACARMPGAHAESLTEVQDRVWAALADLRAACPGGRVAVVTHMFAILTVVCRVLGMDLGSFRRIWLDRAGITEIRFGSRGAVLSRLNDTAHLAAV